jgi:septum formation protein
VGTTATQQVPPQLILASGSTFRQALLRAAGVPFSSVVAPIDEAAVTAATPPDLAAARAKAKAEAVAALHPTAWVIGADQVLSHRGVPMDKSPDAAAAKARLRELSGSTHHLHSAVHVIFGASGRASFVVDVAMPMRQLSEAALDAYVATGEWRGCVGAYQFENRGVHLFEGVVADQSAVVGLPLQPLLKCLRDKGYDPLLVHS